MLFDTGIDPMILSDPGYIRQAVGLILLPWIFRFHLTDADRIDNVLAEAGVDATDIRTAVILLLHFDHVGGIARSRKQI